MERHPTLGNTDLNSSTRHNNLAKTCTFVNKIKALTRTESGYMKQNTAQELSKIKIKQLLYPLQIVFLRTIYRELINYRSIFKSNHLRFK